MSDYWRSVLAACGGNEGLQRAAEVGSDPGLNRRELIQLLGAGLALAGLGGCTRRAREQIAYNLELVRPGLSLREFSDKALRLPERFRANRYSAIAHGVGVCDEYPAVYYPEEVESTGYDGVLEAGMTICIESYIGEAGGAEGVKLEEQVLVTDTGAEVLSRYPFEDAVFD